MEENALLLTGAASNCREAAQILDFFGVPWKKLSVSEFLAGDHDAIPSQVFCSAGTYLQLIEAFEKNASLRSSWQNKIHSAFIFGSSDSTALEMLVKKLTGDSAATLMREDSGHEWNISNQFPKLCGPMSGLQTTAVESGTEMIFNDSKLPPAKIISGKRGAAFVKLSHKNVPVFLSTADVIDIDSELGARNFDIRRHFLSATPIMMYIKWAFADTCWQPAETSACLIIDDPPLKPRYGFLNFQRLSDLMARYHFTSSIAFIPWNWRRSNSRIVRLFKSNPEKFSLSVHGCDHTKGEFGIGNGGRLRWKINCAAARMTRHQSRTGLRHDPVMVFPQGVFSEAAMRALKGSDFIGAINNEVTSADPQPRTIKISDFWSVAVMNYDNFPIFTRRCLPQGIENFAFDILLGKPCIIVVHHNDCHDDCRHVAEFIERLNAMNARLVWRNLEEVVRHSFRQRKLSTGTIEIEMFGKELLVENLSNHVQNFSICKRESAPEQVSQILVGQKNIDWAIYDDSVNFQIELAPGERQLVRTIFHEFSGNEFSGENLSYRFKAMLRRYLSEFRDNYVMGKSFSH
jgi:hypothetical protein